MTNESGDRAARRRALDPARSFIVQAPAGSGKTALLTQRFLRLLALVDAPEQIIAITFTRKAAAEMRRRILLALSGAEPDAHLTGAHEELTRELARAARARARELGWELEQHPSRLGVHTIDAFCHSLAAQSPILSRAGADLEVIDDARHLYAQAARRTLAHIATGGPWSEAIAALLRHRDVDVLHTEALIATMLATRDQWLPLVLELRGSALRAQLERDLAREVLGHLRAAQARFPAESLRAVSRLLGAAARRSDGEALVAWRAGADPLRCTLEELPRWRALADGVLTMNGDWRRKVNVRQGFPPQARSDKEEFEALLGQLAQDEGLRRELRWLQKIPPLELSDEQWQTTEALIDVLRLAAAELEIVFRESGLVDYSAVLQAALRAVEGAEAPSDLALALDRRIRHLLIDEYQDTSSAQFRLLLALTAEWSAGDGRTVFCVGDPMQSIYRFRQAEVGLFLRTRDRSLPAVALEALRLESNFRSQRGLVDWFNAVFASVLPSSDDIARGAVRHEASAAVRPPQGTAVAMHPILGSDPAIEAESVFATLTALRAREPQATIGVLARQRAHVAQLATRLRDAEIRFQSVELETLDSRPIVRDLFALTRALLHEGDRVAWLAVLRSPVCGMTLTDLEALVRGAPRRTVRELLADAEVFERLSADGGARAARVRDLLEQALARAGRMSVRRNAEELWLALGGPAATLGASALEDAAAFFDHLQLLEARGALPAGEAFNTEFAELYAEPDPEAPPQLQIMTIHKAKGLEFDIVLLPGLGRGRERSDPPLLHWLEVAQPEGPAGLLLAPITGKGAEADPHAAYVERRERECAALEKARLLYVAATRARRELHLFGHVTVKEIDGVLEMRAPEMGSHLELLWPAVRAQFDEALATQETGPRGATPMPARTALRRHAADWRLPGVRQTVGSGSDVAAVHPESARPTFDWASEVTRRVGSAVHAELDHWSRSGHLPDGEHVRLSRNRYSRLLAALGVPAEEREHAVGRVLEALTRTLGDTRGRWLFASDHRAVRTELALSGDIDGVLMNAVIDRTFIDANGVRWIVDFKTSTHEGGALEAFLDNEVLRYREQLTRYATLVARLGAEPLRLGLYFPLLSGWREWEVQ